MTKLSKWLSDTDASHSKTDAEGPESWDAVSRDEILPGDIPKTNLGDDKSSGLSKSINCETPVTLLGLPRSADTS